ncbi:J domain-containing protein isoform X1 [Procambarus clarkii]|uniref:J domain-containing protein isoform X1 n=1 Tax=Procambarus clarkii TaxID=6728 RepID=UPI001E6729D9|nr:J domain-containing protein-like [Procambarus clarkii]
MLGRQSAPLVEVPQSTHTRQHLSSPSPTIMMDEFLSCDKKKDNFYDILGCDPMSSVEQIQAEYKVRALQLHPDKNPDNPEAEGQFQMLQVAKDTLSDPEKRAQYDRWLNSGITISYDKWCGMKQHMTTTLHWATPNTKERMLEPGTSQVAPPKPGARRSSEQGLLYSRGKESVTVSRPTEGWERDSSDVMKKFRNYEI